MKQSKHNLIFFVVFLFILFCIFICKWKKRFDFFQIYFLDSFSFTLRYNNYSLSIGLKTFHEKEAVLWCKIRLPSPLIKRTSKILKLFTKIFRQNKSKTISKLFLLTINFKIILSLSAPVVLIEWKALVNNIKLLFLRLKDLKLHL